MIREESWVQHWDIEYRRRRSIYHVSLEVPYIQSEPDHNVWLEVFARAETFLSRTETLTAITYMNSRKRKYEEDN